MKRYIAVIMVLVMVFSLTACMVRETETTIESLAPEENISEIIEEVISEKIEINAAVFWCDYEYVYQVPLREELNSSLNELEVTYTNYDAAGSPETQSTQVDEAIANGANLLIVNTASYAYDPKNYIDPDEHPQTLCNKAKAAKIPIIFFERYISESVLNTYENACLVVERAGDIGVTQGRMAGQYIIDNYDAIDRNSDGKISYIQMKCTLGHPESEARATYGVEYCNSELTKAGKPELVFYDPNNTDKFMPTGESTEEAFRFMEVALSTNPMEGNDPVELVLCNHDHLSLGVIEALNNVGFNTGEGDFIPVFGLDGSYPELIETGKLTGTVQWNPIGTAETIAVLVENVSNGNHIMENLSEQFNVYEDASIIWVPYVTVPYEIKI